MNQKVILTDAKQRVIMEGVRLFSAAEAASVLHINRNAVYALWNRGLLDYWNINGTKLTNLNAISDFLERTKNMNILKEGT